jgi:hypothetical protein
LTSASPSLRIEFLREELELRRLTCELLVRRFERQSLSSEERSDLLQSWEDMLNESHLLQSTLDLLERDEKEAALSEISGDTQLDLEQFRCFTWFYHAKDKTPQA